MKRPKKPDDLCVVLDDIGEPGLRLSCRKPAGWAAEGLREGKTVECGFADDIGIQLDFFKAGKTVMVRGTIATTLELHCVRCLEGFSRPLEVAFHYNLLPEQDRELPQDMEIPKEEFDAYYYSGTVVDLAPLVLEQIVLHIPTHPLCRDSCKGICPHCGVELNRAPCHCAGEEGAASRFAALRNFSPKQKT